MRRILASSALLLGLLSGACKCPWEGKSVWLATDASQGKTLEARAGDELLLDLPVTPGSKAKWFIVEVDEKVLERKGPAEEQPGGGSVRIPFQARRPGVTDLAASYATARGAPAEKTFRTTVWVR
jgi:predicted secreted protein